MATVAEMLKISNGSMEKAEAMARMLALSAPAIRLDLQLLLGVQGKIDEAEAICTQLLKEEPLNPRVRFNMGWFLLHRGKLLEGMKALDWGRSEDVFGSPKLNTNKPIWEHGIDLKGKTLLYRGEGGMGDEIINIRFVKMFVKMGAKVIVSCTFPLASVFDRVEGVSGVISLEASNHVHYDYWFPSMSAPAGLQLEYDQLPNVPYITPDPYYVNINSKIVDSDKFKVGIRWAGNPKFEHEQFRKFDPEPLVNLHTIPGVQVYSLQRDFDLRPLPTEVKDLKDFLVTWEDTASLISGLDLVITSCTSVAHLAAAMGKPTWIIVPVMSYYTWALPGETSPWYPSVRLFRQEQFENWNAPLTRIRQELEKLIVDRMSKVPELV